MAPPASFSPGTGRSGRGDDGRALTLPLRPRPPIAVSRSDGRAKLVVLTPAGWDAIHTGRAIIASIEADYARRIGADRFEAMCQALQDLLDDLNGSPVRGAPQPGASRRP